MANCENLDSAVKRQQLRVLYGALNFSLVGGLVSVLFMLTFFWEVIASEILVTWAIISITTQLYRLFDANRFSRIADSDFTVESWGKRFHLNLFLSTLVWSVGGIIFFLPDSILHQVLLVFLYAGIAAGGYGSLLPSFRAVLMFIPLLLIPIAINFLIIFNSISAIMAAFIIFFIAATVSSGRRISNSIIDSYRLRYENEHQRLALDKARVALHKERNVIESILVKMRSTAKFDQSKLRCLESPVEKISGDILFSGRCPDHSQHVMLGDFTGHGLTAALGGPLASDIFYAMSAKGIAMSEIANEINHQMCKKMPTGLFLAAIFFEINADRNELRVWNCGMESVLYFRGLELQQELASRNLALGVIDRPIEVASVFKVKPGDLFYAYSDGITETENPSSEMFGQDRLVQTIKEMLEGKTDIQVLAEAAHAFRGAGEQLDDLTVVEIEC